MPSRTASKSKLQVFHECHFGRRGVLLPGERFRVTGGPDYVTERGAVVPLYERGVFLFRAFRVRGVARWIEAYQADVGMAILRVGRPCRIRAVGNLRRKPYRITGKVRDA